ncbi:MlaD family protein [Croceicoccus sp. F390]|uniref:MlaD family protein n=1 Tax=Croceicoccus esteveae TaxID=3075597 RepID=A0ABU2ZDG5_9SPHN|nr:MlaD family protein [Croceicoccus sp. F390]MDT0574640.1 MlaD family protein [Croceicoccus sp. F390]
METRANHLWVGVVTLLLLAALAAFVVWLARLNEGEIQKYDIFFKQSVSGLARGSEVAYSGVPVGQVTEIRLWDKDPEFVRVRIAVTDDVPVLQGTTATVQGSFTGVSTIQMEGAVRGAPPIVALGPEGVPVIPTKLGGLGELLSNAPLLLERLSTLTQRLTLVLSDENQQALTGILSNSERLSGNLADASPMLNDTMAQLQTTLQQANRTLAEFEQVAASTDQLINAEGNSLADEVRTTLGTAQEAMVELKATLGDVRPVARQVTQSTLPEAEAAIRDLRATTTSLRNITNTLQDEGATGLLSGQKVPVYEPRK